jgi:hypothetical protein
VGKLELQGQVAGDSGRPKKKRLVKPKAKAPEPMEMEMQPVPVTQQKMPIGQFESQHAGAKPKLGIAGAGNMMKRVKKVKRKIKV